jgi:hypothetical protein
MAASLAAPHPRRDDMASESIIRNLATGMPLLVFRIIIIKTQAGRGTAEAANIYLLRMEAPCIIRPRILLGEGIASFDDRNRIRRRMQFVSHMSKNATERESFDLDLPAGASARIRRWQS